MIRLPNLTSTKVVRALKRGNFYEVRQTGSHLHLTHDEVEGVVSVPMHNKDLGRGLMKTILKQAKLTEDEFRDLL